MEARAGSLACSSMRPLNLPKATMVANAGPRSHSKPFTKTEIGGARCGKAMLRDAQARARGRSFRGKQKSKKAMLFLQAKTTPSISCNAWIYVCLYMHIYRERVCVCVCAHACVNESQSAGREYEERKFCASREEESVQNENLWSWSVVKLASHPRPPFLLFICMPL